ncbi:MAG: 3-hydroxyacyl-CoA dehydrogenase [Oceanospirillaceae bacterium]|nr:3-hydroxyacyl-CoA dehydrogenase [Oceanospirillaceae bacterium]
MSQSRKSFPSSVGIVGTGLMGRGIAQIAAQAGIPVLLYDSRPEGAAEAKKEIVGVLEKLSTKGKITTEQQTQASRCLGEAQALSDLANCEVVVEAIVEDIEAKQGLFSQLEAVVSDNCILATNTSSLSVTAIAAGCTRPERVAGFHFFSPVPLMKIVEVISGPRTNPHVADRLTNLAEKMGHKPVRAADTPGFIVNHAGRGYPTEALRLLGENIGSAPGIDRILRLGAGFRMGPFELMDLTGLDVSQPVMESIYNQYYQEPRFRPSPIARQRLMAGLLGRKSQEGFYQYPNGQRMECSSGVVSGGERRSVWLSPSDCEAFPQVCALLDAIDAPRDTDEKPASDSLCLLLPVGEDVTTRAVSLGIDPKRAVGLDPLFLNGCRTLMTTPITEPGYRDAAVTLLASDGIPVEVISDSPGFVSQRVVATIVNIASDMAQQGVATPDDIDQAVKLGLGYPLGPLAMGDKLGARTVLRILDNLFNFYRDPRYRPSPWLTRRALLNVSLLTSAT